MVELPDASGWSRRAGLQYRARVLHVLVLAEFKLKYQDSALGYVWSIVRPLSLFTVMYLVFGRLFNLNEVSEYYGIALLTGIVLWSFFAEATAQGMISLVARESLLRRLRFPNLIVTTAATMTAAMTLGINLLIVGLFVAWQGITPQLDWILLVPLLLELYVFTLGLALILTTLFIPLRDIGQAWDLVAQLVFYASPVIYPVALLPDWLEHLAFLSPFTQVMQDVRSVILYDDQSGMTATAPESWGPLWRLLPIAIAIGIFTLGLTVFKRHERWFAERT